MSAFWGHLPDGRQSAIGRKLPPDGEVPDTFGCPETLGLAPGPQVLALKLHTINGARSPAARTQAASMSSSKSSVSFFIIVPPSSSASTMVTARR
jgi:hypothetical protein